MKLKSGIWHWIPDRSQVDAESACGKTIEGEVQTAAIDASGLGNACVRCKAAYQETLSMEFSGPGWRFSKIVQSCGINCDAVSLDDHPGFECHGCRKKTKLHVRAETTDGMNYYQVMLCPTCISTMNQKLMLAMAGQI